MAETRQPPGGYPAPRPSQAGLRALGSAQYMCSAVLGRTKVNLAENLNAKSLSQAISSLCSDISHLKPKAEQDGSKFHPKVRPDCYPPRPEEQLLPPQVS